MDRIRARRVALRALLGSIAVAAAMGLWAVLGGAFGELEGKVLLTSLSLSGASVLAMASLTAWHIDGARILARVGVAAALGALALVVPGMWLDVDADAWWQLAASLALVAAAGAHGSLLAHARLAPRFAWARPTAISLAGLLVCLLLAVIWEVADDDGLIQAIAALSILLAAATLALAVFHWMSRVEPRRDESGEVRFCPGCGARMWQPAGEVRCPRCHRRFFVEPRPSSDVPAAVARRT